MVRLCTHAHVQVNISSRSATATYLRGRVIHAQYFILPKSGTGRQRETWGGWRPLRIVWILSSSCAALYGCRFGAACLSQHVRPNSCVWIGHSFLHRTAKRADVELARAHVHARVNTALCVGWAQNSTMQQRRVHVWCRHKRCWCVADTHAVKCQTISILFN